MYVQIYILYIYIYNYIYTYVSLQTIRMFKFVYFLKKHYDYLKNLKLYHVVPH